MKELKQRAEMAEIFIENLGLHIDAGADIYKIAALLEQWLGADHGERLADVRAEAGRVGFIAGLELADSPIRGMLSKNDLLRRADEYAAKVRGGAK